MNQSDKVTERLKNVPRINKNIARLSPWQKRFFRRFYAGNPNWNDGVYRTVQFLARHLDGGEVLEVGCGPENRISRHVKTWTDTLIGLDLDARAAENPAIDLFRLFDGRIVPFGDEYFNSVFSNMVVEHVQDIDAHFHEIYRVLKPGGHHVFNTPNKWFNPLFFLAGVGYERVVNSCEISSRLRSTYLCCLRKPAHHGM